MDWYEFSMSFNEMVGIKEAWQWDELEILYAWMIYDELKWVGPRTWKALALKVGTINVYMHGEYYLVVWLCLVCVSNSLESLGETFRVTL